MVASAFATAFTIGALAQTPASPALPLENLGLEHLDIVVPDPAASARFYTRIFRTVLHQQPLRDSLRYFILLGDLPPDRQVGYVAIGAAAPGRSPSIGHYCVLAAVYDRASVAGALERAGFSALRAGAGGFGMWPDPDGLELQLFQPPAGLVAAAVRSPLAIAGDGMITPLGVDHVMLLVSSLERSLPYYRLVYGAAAEGPRNSSARVWFTLQRGTRIGLQQISDGRGPTIGHFAIKVAPFDRRAFTARLRELAVNVLPSDDEPDVVRFLDPNGITVELRVVPAAGVGEHQAREAAPGSRKE
jgi:catechol 2,3-dioxygenase-like lactoylglutathione lyase family enzyme